MQSSALTQGMARIMYHILEFYTRWNISAKNIARHFKFCTQVGHMKYNLVIPDYPPSGCCQGHVSHFYILGPRPYLWNGWSQKFQIWFADWAQRVVALHMTKFCSMGVHLGLCDRLKFREISANLRNGLSQVSDMCNVRKNVCMFLFICACVSTSYSYLRLLLRTSLL